MKQRKFSSSRNWLGVIVPIMIVLTTLLRKSLNLLVIIAQTVAVPLMMIAMN